MTKEAPHWYDALPINIYFLGLSLLSQTLTPIVLPLLIQSFVGPAQKATYFGVLRLWGLMVALLVQALMGILSDHSKFRMGRRRPFILVGNFVLLGAVVGIIFSTNLTGMTGFWILFGIYLVMQIGSNTAQAAAQGFIPDLVPEEQRGRFSAVKALMEVPIPVILVAVIITPVIGNGNMVGGLLIMGGIIAACTLITMFVREEPLQTPPPPLEWGPFLRLLLMTGVFTVVILLMREGVQMTGRLLADLDSKALKIGLMGAVGLVGMALAIGVGVGFAVRVSLGQEKAQNHTSFTWWVIGRLAFLVGAFNLSGFVLYFIQGRLGYSEVEAAEPAGQLMMVVGISLLVAALPSGWLTDRIGRKRMVAISGIVAAVGTLLLLLAGDLATMYIGGAVIGLATGSFYTANWALGTSLVPQKEAGRYLGIANLAGAGAGAVGAYISGPIADYLTLHVPDSPGLGYVLVFALYGLLFLFSVVALWWVEEPGTEVTLVSEVSLEIAD